MPPKIKVTKQDIINSAIEITRQEGVGAVNARAIAARLSCSTQPIFSNFSDMNELQGEIIATTYALYYDFITRELADGKYPPYKSFGMAYIRFANDEKELFKLLFMRDRTNEDIATSPDFDRSVKMIMEANGVSLELARLMHLEMWTCVHGIGVMLATSFLSLDSQLISDILTDVYQGIRSRHVLREAKQ